MMKYVVNGTIRFGNGDERRFERTVEAKSEAHARDVVMALFGSNNGVKRSQIKIESVKEVKQ